MGASNSPNNLPTASTSSFTMSLTLRRRADSEGLAASPGPRGVGGYPLYGFLPLPGSHSAFCRVRIVESMNP